MGHQLVASLAMLLAVTSSVVNRVQASTGQCYNLANRVGCFHGCPYLRDPGNGRVTYEGTTASFVCDSGYKLVGSSSVNCNNCGKWQGEAPVCVAVCNPADLSDPPHGSVEIVNGVLARYTCDLGFTLIGSYERFCDNGLWAGATPKCLTGTIYTVHPGEVDKIQIGINPRITVVSGVFDILGPEVLITHCNATTTFNYRTNSTGNVTFTASLLLVHVSEDGTEVLSNQSIASTAVEVSQSNKTFVCLPLVCGNEGKVSLVRIGRVKITASVGDGIAEVSDVDFQDSATCNDSPTRFRRNTDMSVQAQETSPTATVDVDADCDNTTNSGDCGFRDTGCGTTGFEVTLTGLDQEDENDEFMVSLQKNRTTDNCQVLVCLSCLTESGFVVSGTNFSDSNGSAPARRRRATDFTSDSAGKSFCLTPNGNNVAFAEVQHKTLTKNLHNKYLSFYYHMRTQGLHQLIAYVLCDGQSTIIQLGKDRTVYYRTHYDKKGQSDTVCLGLHGHIEHMKKTFGLDCTKFNVVFQGVALFKKLCISNISYLKESSVGTTHACRSVDNN